MGDFEDMWKTAPIKAESTTTFHSCCQEILFNYTPPPQPGPPAIESPPRTGRVVSPGVGRVETPTRQICQRLNLSK
jgi:hypothetical protein